MAHETFWVCVWTGRGGLRAVQDEVGRSVGLSLVLDVEARRGGEAGRWRWR